MAKTSSFGFVSQLPRGVRVLLASADPSVSTPLVRALRTDGHEVLVVSAPSELAFAVEVVDQGLGPAPDILVLDADLGTSIEGRMARGHVFLLLAEALSDVERHRTLVEAMALENITLFRKPLDLDDLRTAVLKWRPGPGPAKSAVPGLSPVPLNQLTPTVDPRLQSDRPWAARRRH